MKSRVFLSTQNLSRPHATTCTCIQPGPLRYAPSDPGAAPPATPPAATTSDLSSIVVVGTARVLTSGVDLSGRENGDVGDAGWHSGGGGCNLTSNLSEASLANQAVDAAACVRYTPVPAADESAALATPAANTQAGGPLRDGYVCSINLWWGLHAATS